MRWATFHNRRAAQIENDGIRVTVTVEGGHIARSEATRVGSDGNHFSCEFVPEY